MHFNDSIKLKWAEKKFVCVGLDPVIEKIPQYFQKNFTTNYDIIYEFLKRVIDSTADLVCTYKPNIAFFEQYGIDGEKALISIIEYLHSAYPEMPIIGDFKRGDIGNTNKAYAKTAFEVYKVDAITLSPYLGSDTLEAFEKYEGKGLILLCRTSNSGSAELQDMPIDIEAANQQGLISQEEMALLDLRKDGKDKTIKMYELVAFLAANRWNKTGDISLVVGATHPEAFASIRKLAPTLPFLIPGVGTQGGNLEETLRYAPDANGQGIIINSSSGVLYASNGEDFGDAAKAATLKLHQEIVSCLK